MIPTGIGGGATVDLRWPIIDFKVLSDNGGLLDCTLLLMFRSGQQAVRIRYWKNIAGQMLLRSVIRWSPLKGASLCPIGISTLCRRLYDNPIVRINMTKFTAILALLLLLSPVAMAQKTGPSGEPPTPPPGALGYGYWRYFDGGSGRQVFEWVEPGGYVLVSVRKDMESFQ